MNCRSLLKAGSASCAIVLVGLIPIGQAKPAQLPSPAQAEQERQVTEADVPKAALDALKKLAGTAAITEFAQEIEHGHKFYEGSWAGPNGNIDAVVTESGDLVVLEEIVPADKVPSAVRNEAQKAAGPDGQLTFEKKTQVLYELHFKKDGKDQEMLLTPDARLYDERAANKDVEKDENDEDHEHE